jgi:hypothetical protein
MRKSYGLSPVSVSEGLTAGIAERLAVKTAAGGKASSPPRAALRWIWAVAVLILAASAGLLATALRAERPVRPGWSHPLADGTTLRLEAVTFGTEHHWEPGFVPMSRLRSWLPFLPWRPEFSHFSNGEALVGWMTRRGAGGRTLGFEWWSTYDSLDEHGCRFFGDGQLNMSSVSPNGNSGASASGGRLGPPDPSARMTTAYFDLSSFPRRRQSIRLRLYGEALKRVAEFSIPNPVPGPHPVWTPEPLLITKQDGDLAITLLGLTPEEQYDYVEGKQIPIPSFSARFVYRQNGRPTDAWEVSGPELSDATGNVSPLNRCSLCPREAAWKLSARFFRTARARFAPTEVWTVRGVPVVGDGQVRRLSGSARIQGLTLQLDAIAGAGDITYTNRVPRASPSQRPNPTKGMPGLSISGSSGGGTERTEVTSGLPHVAVRWSGITDDWRVSLRAVDDRGRLIPGEHLGSYNDQRFFNLKIPPGSRKLDLTFAVHRARRAEFLVKPPRPLVPPKRG